MHFRTALAIALAFSVGVAPACASAFTNQADVEMVKGLSMFKTRDLDFGVIVPDKTTSGTVEVAGRRRLVVQCSSVLVCSGAPQSAAFAVRGSPSRMIELSLPPSTTLANANGDTMTLDQFYGGRGAGTYELGSQFLTNENGRIAFYIGGRLLVGAAQPPGRYAGTFVVTIEYQ